MGPLGEQGQSPLRSPLSLSGLAIEEASFCTHLPQLQRLSLTAQQPRFYTHPMRVWEYANDAVASYR